VANSVTVPVGPDGRVAVFNSMGSVDVVADVVGWFDDGTVAPGSLFNAVVPTRVLDSRTSTGGWSTPWGPATTRSVRVTGSYGSGVPTVGVSAVVLNVTATGTTSAGYLTVYPTGAARPTASNLNWARGETRPNLVTVPVGVDGQVTIFNSAGQADVLADVVGYYAATGAGFHTVGTTRILDSRTDTGGYATPWGPSTVRPVQTTGTYGSGVPTSGVVAVVMNVTVTDTTGSSYLAVHPGDVPAPSASNLNWVAGWTVPNEVITKVTPTGVANITNGSGSTAVIADIAGWFG
jgi:hypothetical protein